MRKKANLKTKDRILTCAIEEFIEYGFYGARMQRIADRAKVNKAMLFYYFTSKDQIYKEVLGSVLREVIEKLNRLDDKPLPFKDKIRQIIDIYFDMFISHPDYVKLMQYELMTGGKHLQELLQGMPIPFNSTGRIYQYFAEKMKAGQMRNVDILQLVASIIGQVIVPFIGRPLFESIARSSGQPFDFDRFIADRKEFVVSLLFDGLKIRTKEGFQ
jgi:AcrR family transcriptional regulator